MMAVLRVIQITPVPCAVAFHGIHSTCHGIKNKGWGGETGLITLGITELRSSASVCNDGVTASRGDCYQDNAENEAGK